MYIFADEYELKSEFVVFKEVCESLGYKVFVTDFHSTENYISQEAINSVLNSDIQKLGKFEKFENQWKKEINWLMFREMNLEDFKESELNTFIINEMK